jgi:hypothetical protein
MKLSGYYKQQGNEVILKINYENLDQYDLVLISKVFTDTLIPDDIINLPNVQYGGTGFFYENAPPLPDEIEHHMPDYHLYDDLVAKKIKVAIQDKENKLKNELTKTQIQKIRNDFSYYTDYSIGFLTRGCFRKCPFCVNKKYNQAISHSSVNEFLDADRPKLCFLDDNFFACSSWKQIIQEVKVTNKYFQFKQGLDERLLNDEKIHELVSWKYDDDYIFAFDNIKDKDLIENKLKRIFQLYPSFKKRMKFYVLCGYDYNEKWDEEFWIKDIKDTFERILILSKYSALPYIMRYEKCYTSKYKGMYTNLASWCNQPSIFKKFSFKLYSQCRGMSNKDYKKYKRNIDRYIKEINKKGSCWVYMEQFEKQYPDIANTYFNIVPDSILEYGNGKKEIIKCA